MAARCENGEGLGRSPNSDVLSYTPFLIKQIQVGFLPFTIKSQDGVCAKGQLGAEVPIPNS